MLSINPIMSANFGEYDTIFKKYKTYHKYIQYEKIKSGLNDFII